MRFARIALLGLMMAASTVVVVFADEGDPAWVVAEYYDRLTHSDAEGAYQLLVAEERQAVSPETFVENMSRKFGLQDLMAETQAKFPTLHDFIMKHLYSIDVDGTEAADGAMIARVIVTVLDIFSMAMQMAEKYPEMDKPGIPDAQLDDMYGKALRNLYGDSPPPTVTETVLVHLKKEDGAWRVVSGVPLSVQKFTVLFNTVPLPRIG